MSSGARQPWETGKAVADVLMSDMGESTTRMEIAGSLRRRTADVGDVELVAVPAMAETEVPDGLWGTAKLTTNVLLERLVALVHGADPVWAPHPDDPKEGERYWKFLHVPTGLQIDLFMVLPPAQFGIIHLARTGPETYSRWFVKAIRAKGYHMADGALHWGTLGCGSKPCAVVATPEEKDVYAKTGIPYLLPQYRDRAR